MARAALDLGTQRAAFVRTARASETEVRLLAGALVSLERDADDAARARKVAGAIGGRAGAPLALGISGRDAILRYLHLMHVPLWRLRLLMEVEVKDVAEKAGEPLSADWRELWIPEDIAGHDGTTILVGLAKEPALLARYGALGGAGLEPETALPSAVALFNAYVGLGHHEDGKSVLLLDAGPEGAELAILRDGLLVFARGIPAPREPGDALSARDAQQLASAVASSLPFCKAQQKLRALPMDRALISGAYGRSPELLKALAASLKVPVETFDPLERMDLSALSEAQRKALAGRGPELVVAVGLALAGDHPRSVTLDLTPAPVQARRNFRRRTAFLIAAGALLAVALGVAIVTADLARKGTRERRDGLRKIAAGLEERRQAMEAQAKANQVEIQVVDALARRTQPGGAALRLLARLREATPARVTVEELTIVPPQAPRPGQPAPPTGEVLFQLRGEVDNAAGDAIPTLSRFEAALREDEGVTTAKVTGTPAARPGSMLEFVMAVALRERARGPEE